MSAATRRSPSHREGELIFFLGPSLPAEEARRLAGPCLVLPPARQGDVLRALVHRPKIIALIDGVFEAQPSVWHRELLGALDAGVTVLGASSMGALRAAELAGEGMVGVGQIFEWVRDGVIEDDSEVALLHAAEEDGFRPLTVPLVNVRHAVSCAVEARVLTASQGKRLVERARAVFYQERSWPLVLQILPASVRERWRAWAADRLPDLKRQDALSCVQEAAARRAAGRASSRAEVRESAASASTWLRRARLELGRSASAQGAPVENRDILSLLEQSDEADELRAGGLRRQLLASWAKATGLRAEPGTATSLLASWKAHLVGEDVEDDAFFACLGMDAGEAHVLMECLALESQLLGLASRWVSDGPSGQEALASQSRLDGTWLEAARRLRQPGSRKERTELHRRSKAGRRK